jgi:hypothetical protein
MKIRVIQPCVVDKKQRKVDEVIDVQDKTARELISMERAVPHRDAQPVAAPAPVQVAVQQPKHKK